MKRMLPVFGAVLVTLAFFYRVVTGGSVPFPGDARVSDYQPFRSASYLGYNPGSYPSKAQYPDTIRQMYPWKTLVVNALRRGALPLWNPHSFSGAPLLANFQSQALYPGNIVYLFLSQKTAWTVLVMLQPFLAMLFTYYYVRRIGVRYAGAVMAALSYGFSGYMAVWLEYNLVGHVILWLPLVLLCVENLRESVSARWVGACAGAVSVVLLAGHPQVAAYLLVFSAAYAAVRVSRPAGLWVLIAFLLGGVISAAQMFPGMELISASARSPHDPGYLFSSILIRPWQLFTVAFPNLFGNPATRTYWLPDTYVGKVLTVGLVPLFFLPSAVRKPGILPKFFLASAGIVLILVTASPVTALLYRLPIPLVSTGSPTLMTFLLAFALSVLGGMGLDYWITDRHSVRKLAVRTLEVFVLIAGIGAVSWVPVLPGFHENRQVAVRALLYGGALSGATLALFYVFIRFRNLRVPAVVLMLAVHASDLFVFFARFNPFVPPALVFPTHPVLTNLSRHVPDRFWGYGTASVPANIAAQYGLFSPEGYDPLYPRRYGQFLYSYRSGSVFTAFDNATRSDAAVGSHFGDGGLSDERKRKVLSALSVRYVLDRTENASDQTVFPSTAFRILSEDGGWRIYENLESAPRAFFVRNAVPADTAEEFSRAFFSDTFHANDSAVVSKKLFRSLPPLSAGTATVSAYAPETITVSTRNPGTGLLVLTDTDSPGWTAGIDGAPVGIHTVNWTLKGVMVPAGTHTVTFTYSPKSVRYGFMISAAGIIMTFGVLGYLTRKHA